jgi:hypothetical protein
LITNIRLLIKLRLCRRWDDQFKVTRNKKLQKYMEIRSANKPKPPSPQENATALPPQVHRPENNFHLRTPDLSKPSSMEDVEKALHHSRAWYGCINFRNQLMTFVVAILTAIFMTFTIFFAYNSSLENPVSTSFVSKTPETSILILNLALQLTLFALAELTSSVLEATRWSLACRATGTTALTFITLSRATGLLGTAYLTAGKSRVQGRNGHRIWGAQRYI